MPTFTGAPLSVQSVTARSNYSVLRIRFGNDPVATNPAGANDALNVTNYDLTGPETNALTGAATVPGDPQSIDLTLVVPLSTGTWTVTAANLVTAEAAPLEAPFSASVTVTVISTQEGFNPGATNDSTEKVLRKHLSPALRGRFIDGLIAAFAVGEKFNWENARLAFNQLFKSTASGIYLDRKTGDDGLTRPKNVGMGDELYRRYAIKTTNKKLIQQVMLEIMEVFYGSDATRAHVTTAGAEPFNLSDGMELDLLADEKDAVKVVLSYDDFAQISRAKAVEVAAVITRHFHAHKLNGYALVFEDPETGEKKVRIYSSALGLAGSMRVRGGQAQNVLKFPDSITGVQTGQTWTVSIPNAWTVRFTLTGASTTDLSKVRVGDYVNVFGATVAEDNRGSFPITKVDVRYVAGVLTQYFEIANDAAVAGTFETQTTDDLLFFRPSRKSINGARTVIVSQPEHGLLDIVLPATTLAVERTVKTGSYVQRRADLTITSIERIGTQVTATTSTPHGLSPGEFVFIDNVVPSHEFPDVEAGDGINTTDYSVASIWAPTSDVPGTQTTRAQGVVLSDGRFLMVGGHDGATAIPSVRVFEVSGSTALNGTIQHTYSWSEVSESVARDRHRIGLLADGRVLMTGGEDETGVSTNGAYIYDPDTDSWDGPIAQDINRRDHEQVLLDDDRVLICGGYKTDWDGSAELFTPGTSTFATTASMSRARGLFRAVKLDDGRVLVTGGYNGSSLAECEIFDPVTNTWSSTGAMSERRRDHQAILLPNNQVLVMGGVGGARNDTTDKALASCEIWDGNTGRWNRAGRMGEYRRNFAAVLLPDGKVLVAGGNPETFSEIFDPETRKWKRAAFSLPEPRFDFAFGAVAGGMFVAGGEDEGGGHLTGAVLYIPNSEKISGSLAGLYRLDAASDSTLEFTSLESGYLRGTATAMPATAIENEDIPGPFIFDPYDGVAITETETTSTQALNAGQQYRSLKVADASLFPNEPGHIVVGFGTKYQTGPVRYLGRLSSNELVLDYGFRFPVTVASGATVTLLDGKTPFVPANPEEVGSFYLTDSSAGRVAASKAIDDSAAAGVEIRKTIRYPGDRGLGGEGLPASGAQKLSDKVAIWAGDDIDAELEAAREG